MTGLHLIDVLGTFGLVSIALSVIERLTRPKRDAFKASPLFGADWCPPEDLPTHKPRAQGKRCSFCGRPRSSSFTCEGCGA